MRSTIFWTAARIALRVLSGIRILSGSPQGVGLAAARRRPSFAVRAWLLGALAISCPTTRATAANFLVQGTTPARAAALVQRAEETRARAFREILGADTPAGWSVPCEIHLHDSEAAFADAVGGPPDDARGATSIEFAGDEVVFRRIDLMDDEGNGMPAALAHELVHVVLADRFTAAPPPRWADEGLAVLYDDPATQAAHEQDFQEARRTGMTWSASHLLAMEEYPRESHRQRIFYGQSAALVRWLIARRDAATFLEFLEDAALDQSAALERHYGLPSTAALDRAWLDRPAITDMGAE